MCIVRAITSRSLNGTLPDYRALDVGCATVPIRIRKELVARFSELKAANPYAGPDPDDNQVPPEQTLTPNYWASDTNRMLKEFEDKNWITSVDAYPATAQWDNDAKRIMGAAPTIVKSINHQLGVVVRQQAT